MNNPTLLASAIAAVLFSGATYAQTSSSSEKTTADGSPIIVITSANRFAQPVSSVLAPVEVVTQKELARWQVTTVTEALRRLPGLQIAQNGGMGQKSSVFIRGNESRHVLVLIDGIRVAQSANGTGSVDFNQLPLALVERIEYIRGPRSSTYGADAIGGVINIITGRETDGGNLQASAGSLHYQNYQGSVRNHVTDRTVVSVAGQFTDTRGYDVVAGTNEPDRDGFRSRFAWASVEHKFSESTEGFVRIHGSANQNEYDGSYSNRGRTYTRQYDSGLRFNQDNYSSQLIASYQDVDSDTFAPSNMLRSHDEYNQRTLQWMNNYQVGYGQIGAGIDWNRNQAMYSNQAKSRDNTGVYLTTQQRIGDWTLEGAVRQDHNQDYGNNFTWQSAVGWQFIDSTQAVLSYGTAFKAPTLSQLYGSGTIDSNPELKAESSRNLELAFSGQLQALNWRVSTYRNKVDNLITYYSTPTYDYAQYRNTSEATIKGIETEASFNTAAFMHTLSFDYTDPRDQDGNLLLRRAQHTYKYMLDFEVMRMQFNIAYQYVGKRADVSNQTLPSYSLWDLAASYPITQSLTARGRIANLFDKKYETAYGYPAAERAYYLTLSYDF